MSIKNFTLVAVSAIALSGCITDSSTPPRPEGVSWWDHAFGPTSIPYGHKGRMAAILLEQGHGAKTYWVPRMVPPKAGIYANGYWHCTGNATARDDYDPRDPWVRPGFIWAAETHKIRSDTDGDLDGRFYGKDDRAPTPYIEYRSGLTLDERAGIINHELLHDAGCDHPGDKEDRSLVAVVSLDGDTMYIRKRGEAR